MSKSNQTGYRPPSVIKVRGAEAPDGTPYVRITASGRHQWLPRSAFTGSGSTALAALTSANIPLIGDEWAQCRNEVVALKSYPPKPLIDRVGWNGAHFALGDGTVFSPHEAEVPVVLFRRNHHKFAQRGAITKWRRGTAILIHQPIATFVLFTAFVGPLLRLGHSVVNQGFELADPKGVGKSTLQRLAAAVYGPADSPEGFNYWVPANVTVNGLEGTMAEHRDLSMVIEETNLFAAGETDKARATKFNELVFKLANGTGKRRHEDPERRRDRYLFLTSTNEPLAQLLLGHRVVVSDAASDRLLTIAIEPDRPYGVFDSVLPGQTSGEMAQRLNACVRNNHGLAIRQYLQRLVIDCHERPKRVETELNAAIETFRDKVGVDRNDGSALRVADAFGMVYAAGLFAMRYEAVSLRLDPLRAAMTCYDLNRAAQADSPNLYERLIALAEHPHALRIPRKCLPQLIDADIDQAPAIVRTGQAGRVELLLTESQLRRAFPVKRLLFEDERVLKIAVAENGRKQTKRKIRKGHDDERFYCFRLNSGKARN